MTSTTIKKISVNDLIPYINNSRTHSDEQVLQIAASIKEFGFLNPIIVDGSNGIIAGHGRVMAAKKLGLDEVPCIDASHLSEAQKKAYIIADNKLALNAGWDDEILRIELNILDELDFDLSLTGFSDEELQAICQVEEIAPEYEDDADGEIIEPPPEPKTKEGDVWLLGAELCGKRIGSVWKVAKDGASTYVHPTQKPVELSMEAIDKTTKNGATVLDLFGGSGSTLIGCEKTNRRAYLMELDPKYCDVIINRWQTLTGKEATLESTGETYNDSTA